MTIVLLYNYSLRYRLHQEFAQTVTDFDADDTEPPKDVSRFGLAVRRLAGKQKDLGSIPLRLFFRFKNCDMWSLCL